MHLDELMTDAAVLSELGSRLERHRLARNWTQAELALQAGLGQATVQRAERGQSVQLTSLVKLLRTLELLGALDMALPEAIELPIAELERRESRERHGRRRASGRRGGGSGTGAGAGSGAGTGSGAVSGTGAGGPWQWGDGADSDRSRA
jgi:transcriptional regulator with XRE-family HTH domain